MSVPAQRQGRGQGQGQGQLPNQGPSRGTSGQTPRHSIDAARSRVDQVAAATPQLGPPTPETAAGTAHTPLSLASTTTNHGAAPASRRDSIASSATGIGGVLDSSSHRGSVAEAGQNAIFTLLQPQIVRTGILPQSQSLPNWRPPTTRDIPPVTLSNIPQVDQAAVQSYLSLIGSSNDTFRRVKAVIEQTDASFPRPSISDPPPDTAILARKLSAQSALSETSPSTTAAAPATRVRGPATAPLSSIPSIYFDDNFCLENPRTFDFVTERSDIARPRQQLASSSLPTQKPRDDTDATGPVTGRKALATNAILQEKLSYYLDTIEIHLLASISNASTTFFSALASLQALHAEATASVDRIHALQNDLANLDRDMAMGGLQLVQLQRRRENVRSLTNATAQLQMVVHSVSTCEKLIRQGDYMRGLDELEDVIQLMAGEVPSRRSDKPSERTGDPCRLVDLRRLNVLEGASNDLDELRSRIRTGLEREFTALLLDDLRRHVAAVPVSSTLSRLDALILSSKRMSRSMTALQPPYAMLDDTLRGKLQSLITGLGRVGYAASAAATYKNDIFRELKSLVRRHLPSAKDDDNVSVASGQGQGASRHLSGQERSTILARNLRNLDPEDAYEMLCKMYSNVSECLRRLGTQLKVLLDILSGFDDTREASSATDVPGTGLKRISLDKTSARERSVSPVAPPSNRMLEILDTSHLLAQAVELVQGQIIKVVRVRSEQTARLPLLELIRYVNLNKLFATECEAISGNSSTALNALVNSQIKDFITNFSDSQLRRLVQAMDSDRWDARDFGDDEQQCLSHILAAEADDPPSWRSDSQAEEGQSEPSQTVGEPSPPLRPRSLSTATSASQSVGKEKVRTANIGAAKYILPGCAIAMLSVLEEYLHLIAEMPSMAVEISPRLLECLRLFNSRSSQLILGAGATRSAGLKNITTKHLALASQALSFIVALVPAIQTFLARHAGAAAQTGEFDKVKRLYQDHQTGIHEKLVEIMSSRAAVHVAAMKKIDWDAAEDTTAVSRYMEVLTKETGTLYRVLLKNLPASTVSEIMKPVFDNYRQQWTEAFSSRTIDTETGRQRMLSDLASFKSRIDKIPESGDLSDHLISIVNAKSIAATANGPVPSHEEDGAAISTP